MLLVQNGKVMTMTRPAFIGDIAIKNGKISAIGTGLSDVDAKVFDAAGCYVMPGLIDAHCHIGLCGDGMGDAGEDVNESSEPVTPQMRAIDGLNPFDPCFFEARSGGVTSVLTGPGSANVVGGQFIAMKTAGDSAEAMTILAPAAMKAAFGENPKRVYQENKASPYTRMAIAAHLRQSLVDAEEYIKKSGSKKAADAPERDLGKEAMARVIRRELPMKMHAHRADDILTALRIAKEFNIRVTLDHCTEAHLILDQLKREVAATGAAVILGPLMCERSKVELRNLSARTPLELYRAGIPFALMTDHPCIPIQYLNVLAAIAAREGLPEEEALRAITVNAAIAAGIASRTGTLEVGKDADIAVFDGHPLEYRTKCVMTIVDGAIVYQQ